MLIHIVRHGLTDWNVQRRFQGTCDVSLNEQGIAQAKAAAARCSSMRIERIYHSPLSRAEQTAKILSDATGAPLTPVDELHEVCLGQFQGLSRSDVRERYADAWAAYTADPAHVPPPKGESLADAQARVIRTLCTIVKDASSLSQIAIVSHGALIKAMCCFVLGIPLSQFSRFDISNGSITTLEYSDNLFRMITMNDLSHFSDPFNALSSSRLLI